MENIKIKVVAEDKNVIYFKIKKTTPLKKLMRAYCAHMREKIEVMRFKFDGEPIDKMKNPSQLEMEDGDTIDVFKVDYKNK